MISKHPKIIVADDDHSFRTAVSRLLDANKYHVVEVSRAISLIKTIIREGPDLILLDLVMPGAHGIDIINTMNRMGLSIPVVVISGNLNTSNMRILQERGVRHFLSKPVDMKTLLAKVEEVLGENSIEMGTTKKHGK